MSRPGPPRPRKGTPVPIPVKIPTEPPPNFLVDRNRAEPTIAANPRDPRNLVAAANPNYSRPVGTGYPVGAYYSINGGKTWRQSFFPVIEPYTTQADTALAFDDRGRVYFSMLAEAPNVCNAPSQGAAIVVTRSDDGGQTWGPAILVERNPPDEHDDKPYLGVDARRGTVFVTWTRYLDKGGSKLVFARSTNGGESFSRPRVVYRSSIDNTGTVPLSGPHGEVYIIWSSSNATIYTVPVEEQLFSITSLDGGITWDSPVLIRKFSGLPLMLTPGKIRTYSMATAVVARHSGAIYVAWPVTRRSSPDAATAVEADIVLSRSLDQGAHWSSPVAVNDRSDGDRFMPQMSSGSDGTLALTFYDRRRVARGAGHRNFSLYAVGVRDKGAMLSIWPNRLISQAPSSPEFVLYLAPGSTCFEPGRYMGDYIGIATDSEGTAHIVWADTQSRQQNVTDIWSAAFSPLWLSGGPPRKQVPLS